MCKKIGLHRCVDGGHLGIMEVPILYMENKIPRNSWKMGTGVLCNSPS